MGTPSNPGWPTGYVPTASEWEQAFSAKVDYPAAVSQGGSGAMTAYGANYNIAQRSILSASSAVQLCTSYGIATSAAAISVFLPPLAGLQAGDWIDLYDVDFNAAANNVSVVAHGVDQISLYGTPAGTQTLNVSGVRCRLVANTTTWSMIV